MKTTPTTKILAIGTINPGFEQSQVLAVLPEEVRETVDLYLEGKIEQWYSLQGKPGVAFIINVTDPAVAHEMLEKLPLGKAHMMSFELIPIGPLDPLRFRIARMQMKPDKRIVGNIKIAVYGKVSQQQNLIATHAEQIPGSNWVRITPDEKLQPGEYAIVELLGNEGMNLYVWDFGVNLSAPANASAGKPEPAAQAKPDKPSDLQQRPPQ